MTTNGDATTADSPSHWVEFYGGPDDGLMAELPWRFMPGTENMQVGVNAHETACGHKRSRPGVHIGSYRAAHWADEELGIVRMDWTPSRG